MMKVTDRDVLVTLLVMLNGNGYSPSVRELASALNIKSSGAMQHRLRKLKAGGMIHYIEDTPRTITLTKKGVWECLPTR